MSEMDVDGGYFIAEADSDGFVTLYGPYWDGESAAARFDELSTPGSHITHTLIPVVGITASP